MEKLKIPAASVHDTRYFYALVSGIDQKGGKVESSERTLEYFRRLINDYNQSKASSYGLSHKAADVSINLVKDAVGELSTMGLIDRKNEAFALTELGDKIARMISGRERDQLRRLFARAMFDSYSIFEYFLRRIKSATRGEGVPLPAVTSEVFNRYDG